MDRIAVVAADDQLAAGTIATANGVMNIPPPGVDASRMAAALRRSSARSTSTPRCSELRRGQIDAIIDVDPLPPTVSSTSRTAPSGPADGVRSQLAGFAALVDRDPRLDELAAAKGSQLGAFQTPSFRTESISAPTEGGQAVDAVEVASRGFLGTVFVILMFITILIYGMWVATGVAAEKSSRVMELMISAASPRQLADRQGASGSAAPD